MLHLLRRHCLLACVGLLMLGLALLSQDLTAQQYTRYSAPEMFSYQELLTLSQDQEFEPDLSEKLRRITTTPFLSNEAYYRGAKPNRPDIENLGSSLRLVFWNIERGIRLDEIKLLFTDREGFLEEVKKTREKAAEQLDTDSSAQNQDEEPVAVEPVEMTELADRIDILQSADVIVLNEVDWGMKRSGYRAVIQELGEALNMNWAYGVEFVEIDPTLLGTATFESVEDEQERQELIEYSAVDKERLRALHGTAILSRYPIRQAELRPFEFQPYDWYREEKGLRLGEKGIRAGARLIGEELYREMRRGGRTTLLVHLDVPDLSEQKLTVVSPHLENRTKPQNRRQQMGEVLGWIQEINNPVVIAGDLNTTTGDSQSFKLERHLYKKYGGADFWVNQGIKYGTGVGLVYDLLKWGFNFTKNQSDPTSKHVPFVAPNHEQKLFTELEDFRFADGRAFDFRGDPEHTSNGLRGTLANSNQREEKGFAHTYEFVITVGVVGKYKLDWILVKSYSEQPRNEEGSYRFAPHFARTLKSVNFAFGAHQLSDHNPMSVDLPFGDPGKLKGDQQQ
ncbi:MAG: endonuclease/exonuclease/phosphatase family protein [Acidobacteria bacterium]|nr:endonuclease/exonuclease/phosphatase family protein [Acidobacteriota bacterium]